MIKKKVLSDPDEKHFVKEPLSKKSKEKEKHRVGDKSQKPVMAIRRLLGAKKVHEHSKTLPQMSKKSNVISSEETGLQMTLMNERYLKETLNQKQMHLVLHWGSILNNHPQRRH